MTNREKMVSKATGYLRGLARRRSNSTVTADDVQSYLTKNGFRGNVNERLSIVRSVLRSPNFTSMGLTQSSREVARGRSITAWTI
jgi:hypothetical protein